MMRARKTDEEEIEIGRIIKRKETATTKKEQTTRRTLPEARDREGRKPSKKRARILSKRKRELNKRAGSKKTIEIRESKSRNLSPNQMPNPLLNSSSSLKQRQMKNCSSLFLRLRQQKELLIKRATD